MAPRLRWLLLLLPAGCATPGDRDAVVLRQAMESGQTNFAALASIVATPVTSDRPAPRLRPAALPVAAPAGRGAAGMPPVAATDLLGAGPEALRRRLGEPGLRRQEGTAEIWLYAGAACALDLILYPAGGSLRVAHAAARANGAEPRTEAECLRELTAPGGAPARAAEPGI